MLFHLVELNKKKKFLNLNKNSKSGEKNRAFFVHVIVSGAELSISNHFVDSFCLPQSFLNIGWEGEIRFYPSLSLSLSLSLSHTTTSLGFAERVIVLLSGKNFKPWGIARNQSLPNQITNHLHHRYVKNSFNP